MTMTLKERALETISKLPDDATVEDMMYRLYVIEKIEAGLADADAGKVITDEALEQQFETYEKGKTDVH